MNVELNLEELELIDRVRGGQLGSAVFRLQESGSAASKVCHYN